MRSGTISALLISSISVTIVAGWSKPAHQIIADIAYQNLKFDTQKHFAHLFGLKLTELQGFMVGASTWADEAAARQKYGGDLHFSHTPHRDCQAFDFRYDCPNGRCVVSAIAGFALDAADPSGHIDDVRDAVKMLFHLIGDIHNPMHVGFAEDKGGNDIEFSDQVILHRLWDADLVYGLTKSLGGIRSATSRMVSELTASQKRQMQVGVTTNDLEDYDIMLAAAASMASYTSTRFTCAVAYTHDGSTYIESGDDRTAEYERIGMDASRHLMKVAGVRLAEFLNQIAAVYISRSAVRTRKIVAPVAAKTGKTVVMNRFGSLDYDSEDESEADETIDNQVARYSSDCESENGSGKIAVTDSEDTLSDDSFIKLGSDSRDDDEDSFD